MGTATDYDIASLRREIESLEACLKRRIDSVSNAQEKDASNIFALQMKVEDIITGAICAAAIVAVFVMAILRGLQSASG